MKLTKTLWVIPLLVALLATSAFAADRTGSNATDDSGIASSLSSNVPIISGGVTGSPTGSGGAQAGVQPQAALYAE